MSLPTRVHVLPAADVPQGADLVVDEPDSPRSAAERLRDPRAGRPPSLLIRIAELNSPDQIAVLGAQQRDRRVEIEAELRSYTGPLFANIATVAVLEVGPLDLTPGRAEAAITLHTLPFDTIDQPDDAGPPSTTTRVVPFTV